MSSSESINTCLRRIAPKEQKPLEVSKWLALQFLIDSDEMSSLLQALAPVGIYLTGGVIPADEGVLAPDAFLAVYDHYVSQLREGRLPEERDARLYFSSALSVSAEALCAVDLEGNERMIRATLPVVQLQMHKFAYSSVDGKFRSMVHGKEAITWGLQASYPQIFRDPETREILQVKDDSRFPNTALFRRLRLWIRRQTLPTPFIVDGERTAVPIRLGKACFEWINHHPQLVARKIAVERSSIE